jgi:type IV pilus assembly protein PilB
MTPTEIHAMSQTDEPRASVEPAAKPAPGTRPPMNSFLEHLLRNGIVSKEIAVQASEWKQARDRDKRSLIDVLREEFGVPRDVLQYQVAQFYAFRVISPNDMRARRLTGPDVNRLLKGLPEPIRQLALKFKVLPYDVAENQPDKIIVVTPNPSDREVSEVVRALPYKKFEICYMKESDWTDYWRQMTSDKPYVKSVLLNSDGSVAEGETDFEGTLDRDISRGQLQALVENVLSDAVRVDATDIHFVPRNARKTDVLFRIDGTLSLWYSIDEARTEAVAAVVKARSLSMDRYERMAAQEGSTQKLIDGKAVRFRVSSVPVVDRDPSVKYEALALQVMPEKEIQARIDRIGLDPYSLQVFKEALALPQGLVIFTGLQGSGRSTAMTAAVRSVMKPTLNTITVEDPVECILDGARQVKLTHKLSYEDALRAILRHDPDLVMLGEIADRTTAEIALRLATTGHRVFSTVHAHDTVGAIQRLLGMGVEPYLLVYGVTLISTHRQLRQLCPRCKAPDASVTDQDLKHFGLGGEKVTFYRPGNCIECIGGFKGRITVYESLLMTPEIRDTILNRTGTFPAAAIRDAAMRHGMRSIAAKAVEVLRSGLTTVEEASGAMSFSSPLVP